MEYVVLYVEVTANPKFYYTFVRYALANMLRNYTVNLLENTFISRVEEREKQRRERNRGVRNRGEKEKWRRERETRKYEQSN